MEHESVQLFGFGASQFSDECAEITNELLGLFERGEVSAVVDVGPAENVEPKVQSLGKRSFDRIERVPVIV